MTQHISVHVEGCECVTSYITNKTKKNYRMYRKLFTEFARVRVLEINGTRYPRGNPVEHNA